jgi:FixJ family two-component response regulator
MASAATAIFPYNPTNIIDVLGKKLESRPNPKVAPIVFLVADSSEQKALKSLVDRQGWRFETFNSAREFLARPRPLVPSCLILALSLLDLNGLEEQKQIARERPELPIIVISRRGDISISVEAMKAGAVDFLMRPFSNQALLIGIHETLERSRLSLQSEMKISDLRSRHSLLSHRERQVMALVVSGLLNKQVGGELGISEITVKAHRRHLMRKMKAQSLPDLVRMAVELAAAARRFAGRKGSELFVSRTNNGLVTVSR